MTKAYSKIKCIVVGPIHYNTLNVIRSLEQNAIDTLSILIGKPKSNFVTVSKYVKHWISIEDYNDIGITLDNISGYIKQRLPLIAINDRSASEIDKIYDKINLKFILPNCKNIQGGIIQEMSKFRQIEVASQSGFRTPETIMIRPSDFNKDNFHIPFPCIIKPAKSIDGFKSDMKVCSNLDEAEKHIYSFDNNPELLIQQFIPNIRFFLIAGIRCSDGEVIIPGVVEKIKKGSRNNTMGLNAFGKLTKCDGAMIEKCKKYLSNIDYHGLFSFEFANPENEYTCIANSYFIEVNLRSDGLLFFYNTAGFSLPSIWADADYRNSIRYHKIQKEIYGINESIYIKEFLRKESLKGVIKDFLMANCYSYFSITDPRPFIRKFFKI